MTNSTRGTDYIELSTANQDTQANAMADDLEQLAHGVFVHNMLSDADYTLVENNTEYEYLNKYIKITDTSSNLTTGRSILFPAIDWVYIFQNDTAQALTVKALTSPISTGVTVNAKETALISCNGSDFSKIDLRAKDNMTATTDPTTSDDQSAGYRKGSFWFNTVKNWLWVCVEVDVTSPQTALWRLVTQDSKVETESGSTRTLDLTDIDIYIRCINGTSCDVTVPPNSSVAFPIGSKVHIRDADSGTVTIVEGSGVTVNPPEGGSHVLSGTGATVTLLKVATDVWDMMGQTAANTSP